MKKQLKKAEDQINFGPQDVGHLVPMTVGHKNRPTEEEEEYIKTVIAQSDFRFIEEEFKEEIDLQL